jgi:hypothetical protein
MADQYKLFPPFVGHINIPLSNRRAAVAAAGLYTPGRWTTSLLRLASLTYLRLVGPRFLPGSTHTWTPPMDREPWDEIFARIEAAVGTVEEFAIYERRQSTRTGFSLLLLRGGSPVAFARVNRDRHERIRKEFLVLGLLRDARPLRFDAPEPIACGDVREWSYLVTTALLPGRHRIAKDPPLGMITDDIHRALQPLPCPPDTPPHWKPMHGDLVPINLRDAGNGRMVLYDWESVAWAPPGADQVMYRAAEAVLSGKRVALDEWAEAKAFWQVRFARPARRSPEGQTWAVAMQRLLGA